VEICFKIILHHIANPQTRYLQEPNWWSFLCWRFCQSRTFSGRRF